MSKAVYYIAKNKDWGHVCANVWKVLDEEGYLKNKTDIDFSGGAVYLHVDKRDNEYYLVETDKAICLDYERYLPFMNESFSDADVSAMVTWHEGAAAIPNVFTCHTIGDMNSGIFTESKPRYMRNIMKGMLKHKDELGLDYYSVVTEGTHWSGVHGQWKGFADEEYGKPELLAEYPVAMMDIEVGSEESSWESLNAARALARAFFEIFEDDGRKLHNLLCIGGVHFEPTFAKAVFTEWNDDTFGVSHILANQWLVTGEYDTEEGLQKAIKCVESIDGGIEAVIMHDKAKGSFKDIARSLGERYSVPVYKHKKLRNPEEMEF